MVLIVSLNLGLHLWKMQHKSQDKYLVDEIFKNSRITRTSPCRLSDHLPHLTLYDLENESSRKYPTIPFNRHTT